MKAAFLCSGGRTPIGRYGGVLSGVRPDDLAATVLRELQSKCSKTDWERLDEVIFGCANQAGEDNRNVARMSSLLAGLPITVPGVTLNRLCASGMEAVGYAARAITSGEIDLAIAGGLESMSRAPFVTPKAESPFQRKAEIYDTTIGWRFTNPQMKQQYGAESMPETGENVATDFHISRQDQDAFAFRSQERTARAQSAGFFKDEIVAVSTLSGLIDKDEHPRPGTTLEALAKLTPIVRPGGTVTAGNSSGVNDGAAAMVIASEDAVRAHQLQPQARILGMATAGVAPRVMGMGPVPAIQKLLRRIDLQLRDFEILELNEAFASQALACVRELGLPDDADFINPNGGAIALGHPLGMSGARLVLTAAHQLQRCGGRRALAAMCVGVGQGVALALEKI